MIRRQLMAAEVKTVTPQAIGFGVGHEAIAACTEQRRDYFQRCRPREEAMKGGRGSEGDEDGGGAS